MFRAGPFNLTRGIFWNIFDDKPGEQMFIEKHYFYHYREEG